nr:MAG TPA: hypothetical protein [Caudoviricetes sp.]
MPLPVEDRPLVPCMSFFLISSSPLSLTSILLPAGCHVNTFSDLFFFIFMLAYPSALW